MKHSTDDLAVAKILRAIADLVRGAKPGCWETIEGANGYTLVDYIVDAKLVSNLRDAALALVAERDRMERAADADKIAKVKS